VDLAVMLADGGETISDLGVLRDQAALFGPVASDPTTWRLLSGLDAPALAALRSARAAARQVVWAQHAETRGDLPAPMVAGRQIPGLVLDIDATIVVSHSEKESAPPTWKKTFGYRRCWRAWVSRCVQLCSMVAKYGRTHGGQRPDANRRVGGAVVESLRRVAGGADRRCVPRDGFLQRAMAG
jgi:hypothetical protein